jgi:hypothetical protein
VGDACCINENDKYVRRSAVKRDGRVHSEDHDVDERNTKINLKEGVGWINLAHSRG